MKALLLTLVMVSSTMAGDCCDCYDGPHSNWMYELMFGRQNRREEAQRQETLARWQTETDAAIAKNRAELAADMAKIRSAGSRDEFRYSDPNHYNHPNSPGPEIRRAIPIAK